LIREASLRGEKKYVQSDSELLLSIQKRVFPFLSIASSLARFLVVRESAPEPPKVSRERGDGFLF
jgi:hypothetical protein